MIVLGNNNADAEEGLSKKVLILYEERHFFNDARDSISVLKGLFGHFKATVDESAIKDYDFKTIHQYDVIMVVALDNTINSKKMIEQLVLFKGQIIWLGASVGPLLQAGDYPLQEEGQLLDLLTVSYGRSENSTQKVYNIGTKREFYKVTPLDDTSEILSTFSDGVKSYPFIVESRNLLYVSRVDMNEPLFYIFADVMNRYFYRNHYGENQLVLSIEDVHIFRDFKKLRDMADYMSISRKSFVIGLIPFIQQEGVDYVTSFTEDREMIETLQYMQSKGGSIVLHLYTHKIKGDQLIAETKGENFEKELEAYINKALKACIDNQLYPIGAEEPHRSLTVSEYKILKNHFSTFYGQIAVNEGNFVIYPFELENTDLFNLFYPLNLGYILPSEGDPFEMIRERISKIEIVEGYYGGIYFHSYMEPDVLRQVLDYIDSKRMNVTNALSHDHWVKTKEYEYEIQQAQFKWIRNPADIPASPLQIFLNNVSRVMIIFLSGAFLVFMRIIFKLRTLRKNRLLGKW